MCPQRFREKIHYGSLTLKVEALAIKRKIPLGGKKVSQGRKRSWDREGTATFEHSARERGGKVKLLKIQVMEG